MFNNTVRQYAECRGLCSMVALKFMKFSGVDTCLSLPGGFFW